MGGFTTNFGVICGILVCLGIGAALPDPKTHPQEAKDDSIWVVIYCLPAIVSVYNLLIWTFYFKYESVKACFDGMVPDEGGQSEHNRMLQNMALDHLKLIYKEDNPNSTT